jgi:hypothetical protein
VSQPAHNEIFDEHGHLRPGYAALHSSSPWDPLRPPAFIADQLCNRPLGDDTRILPVPWVIDDAEYVSVIKQGIAQRASALQMFFADMVLGEQRSCSPRFSRLKERHSSRFGVTGDRRRSSVFASFMDRTSCEVRAAVGRF